MNLIGEKFETDAHLSAPPKIKKKFKCWMNLINVKWWLSPPPWLCLRVWLWPQVVMWVGVTRQGPVGRTARPQRTGSPGRRGAAVAAASCLARRTAAAAGAVRGRHPGVCALSRYRAHKIRASQLVAKVKLPSVLVHASSTVLLIGIIKNLDKVIVEVPKPQRGTISLIWLTECYRWLYNFKPWSTDSRWKYATIIYVLYKQYWSRRMHWYDLYSVRNF